MKNFKDLFFLEMAYGLAEKAWGWASPNPYVGAVIVKRDVIVGHGFHERPGKPHAEVVALERAGTQAKGSTVYITLEPCVHWGRTPPCIDSLLEARPKRVIVSALDPNPLVFKKGIKKLKEAGIEVSVGLLEEKNRRLNETYIKYITQKIPFVTAKAALTLDGKIATRTFDSKWISSSQTREYVHLLRGEYDAIMVGIGTLVLDDPQLTVRHPNWKGKKIIRVILDSRLRFPLGAKILSTLAEGKILVFTLRDAPQRKADALIKKGVEVIPLSESSSGIDLHEVFFWLGKQEISSLLVEGGRHLLTSLLEARLADKIFLTLSPQLIGGENALPFIGGKGVSFVKDSLNLKDIKYFQIENDMIVEGYF
jgi:diaminohydroxyphosphoribosylaminopyrimidine deaminase/5-amino-6-(5-phosphoribosylamino)uracil reductase